LLTDDGTISPLLSQVTKNLVLPTGDLSDLVMSRDDNFSSYLSKILKVSGNTHPALQSHSIIIFMLGGITPYEVKCALDVIEKCGNPSDLKVSN
jgi:hypothetical protein